MAQAKRRVRRLHSEELKARVISECKAPGASVAGMALAHGLNANLVHRWRRTEEGLVSAGREVAQTPSFVALPLTRSEVSPAISGEIRIEVRRAGLRVGVSWPLAGAGQCAAFLLELLR